jgi:hypothetical protein
MKKLTGIFTNGYGLNPKGLWDLKFGKVKTFIKGDGYKNVKEGTVKKFLSCLMSYCGNNKKYCYPEIRDLMNKIDESKTTIRRCIQASEILNLITVDRTHKNNRYTLNFLDSKYLQSIPYKKESDYDVSSDHSELSQDHSVIGQDHSVTLNTNSNINNNNIYRVDNLESNKKDIELTDKDIEINNINKVFDLIPNKQIENFASLHNKTIKSLIKEYGFDIVYKQTKKHYDNGLTGALYISDIDSKIKSRLKEIEEENKMEFVEHTWKIDNMRYDKTECEPDEILVKENGITLDDLLEKFKKEPCKVAQTDAQKARSLNNLETWK